MSALAAVSALAAERIKLLSTRSPWWCAALAVGGVVGLVGWMVAISPAGAVPLQSGNPFLQFAMVLVLVMATVSVTNEHRFGTVRTTYLAVPVRWTALVAKAVVVAAAGALVGLAAAWGSWLVALLVDPGAGLTIATADDWRRLLAPAAVFAVGAVLAVAVGVLLRQTAGAVAPLLVWPLMVENLVGLVPGVGPDLQQWMPFLHATAAMGPEMGLPLSPWGSLGWFAAVTAVLFGVALVVAERRDA